MTLTTLGLENNSIGNNGTQALEEILETARCNIIAIHQDNMETITLYIFVDEARYLEIVTVRCSQATIRLAFLARHLPPSRDFTKTVAPLRNKYLVESAMIPNESMAINPDSDNII
ncbi:hypothetical protein BGZ74_005023 [Mortierella antarctica]|nr:hypothetical protein BGZ74_005023 [Mortierella antarctica]